ncbi:MAG TPA: hypothetical protein DDZ22_17825, partial [Massilia sp.]|nr:hypothetical protein [Massilia sp.]
MLVGLGLSLLVHGVILAIQFGVPGMEAGSAGPIMVTLAPPTPLPAAEDLPAPVSASPATPAPESPVVPAPASPVDMTPLPVPP